MDALRRGVELVVLGCVLLCAFGFNVDTQHAIIREPEGLQAGDMGAFGASVTIHKTKGGHRWENTTFYTVFLWWSEFSLHTKYSYLAGECIFEFDSVATVYKGATVLLVALELLSHKENSHWFVTTVTCQTVAFLHTSSSNFRCRRIHRYPLWPMMELCFHSSWLEAGLEHWYRHGLGSLIYYPGSP